MSGMCTCAAIGAEHARTCPARGTSRSPTKAQLFATLGNLVEDLRWEIRFTFEHLYSCHADHGPQHERFIEVLAIRTHASHLRRVLEPRGGWVPQSQIDAHELACQLYTWAAAAVEGVMRLTDEDIRRLRVEREQGWIRHQRWLLDRVAPVPPAE